MTTKSMEETKVNILAAAEEIIAGEGILATTISKIARKAGVTTSLVHKYFGTKENLLFTFASSRMEESIEELNEQLQGIQDPESLLRKLIWYSLRYNDNHPGYTRTLLFEARSNRAFYSSPGYAIMKKHSDITMGILNKGVKDGAFRDDIDMRLIRDIIYGTFDAESIGCLVNREIPKQTDDFEDIVQMLLKILAPRIQQDDSTKEATLLKSAEEVFGEHGFFKAKVSEIAERSKLAEGTIYEYFKSKEDLLWAMSVKPLQSYLEQFENAFTPRSPLDKLRRLLRLHFYLYLSNRNFLSVFLLDILLNPKFYGSKSFGIFRQYTAIIEQTIQEGIEEGGFSQAVNPRIFRNMFYGAFCHMSVRWLISKKARSFDMMIEINHLIDLFSLMVEKKDESKG